MSGPNIERVKKPLQLAADVAELETRDPRRRLGDGNDIEYVDTRVLDVPRAVLERGRVLSGGVHAEVDNAYKILRTQVLQKLVAKRWQTLAVVSAGAGEGKTLTAINLGLALASTRSHTSLLVDLDWRRPSVHRYFDFVPERDVVDYLRGSGSLGDVLVNPGVPRFCFLPCKQPLPDASELLGSLGPFVAELKGRYANRVVLFDLPPLLATDDALMFLPHVDGVLLVVEENRTPRADVLRSIEMIGQDRLLGTVVNKSWHKPAKY